MYDIAFLSFDESNANALYFKFLKKIADLPNKVYRIHGVKGIHQAHIAAAKLSTTNMFWVVDVDADLLPNFKFDIKLDTSEEDIVHVWKSKNPINDLVYGYGGVKLLPTQLTLNMNTSSPDMTTNISPRFKSMPAISNITAFNTDPLSTWRSAFRECAKLASKTIIGQLDVETMYRLQTWIDIGGDRPFGEYARGGASAGKWYGTTYKDNPKLLSKINDYAWLEIQFKEHIKLYPPETFKSQTLPLMTFWIAAFRESAELARSDTPDADRIQELLYSGHNEYSRGGASAGKWFGETYKNDPETYAKIKDDSWLEGEFYYHIETHPPETFK
jgi:hypothetical protein